MKITIAICTWNRSRLLRQTLESIEQTRRPTALDWQVVVVDNNSTDDTRTVVDTFLDRMPVKYVLETQQGHAVSRNTAIANATGDYIIWTDNDTIVDPGWLQAYASAFEQNPEAAFFGGPIIPVFEKGKPDWLDATWKKCKGVYAERDLGDEKIELGSGIFPYGANFAIRTETQKQFLYDTADGRKGSQMVGDDEIRVLRSVWAAGNRGYWIPAASLQHVIPDDRATTKYIGCYFVGQGITNVRLEKVDKTSSTAWREAMACQFKWRLKRYLSEPEEWVSHLIRANLSWGEYLAIRSQTGSENSSRASGNNSSAEAS